MYILYNDCFIIFRALPFLDCCCKDISLPFKKEFLPIVTDFFPLMVQIFALIVIFSPILGSKTQSHFFYFFSFFLTNVTGVHAVKTPYLILYAVIQSWYFEYDDSCCMPCKNHHTEWVEMAQIYSVVSYKVIWILNRVKEVSHWHLEELMPSFQFICYLHSGGGGHLTWKGWYGCPMGKTPFFTPLSLSTIFSIF